MYYLYIRIRVAVCNRKHFLFSSKFLSTYIKITFILYTTLHAYKIDRSLWAFNKTTYIAYINTLTIIKLIIEFLCM